MRTLLMASALISAPAWGFVLLSGPRAANLPVTLTEPDLHFVVGSEIPKIQKKEGFLGGKYADLDDDAFFHALINEAMKVWNDVDSAYVNLVLDTDSPGDAALDRNDRIFSIVVDGVNATASAFARPEIDDRTIVDCDIVIGDRETEARQLAYTLMHELGHCLGLGHNHTNYDSVMGYSREDARLKLGVDDKIGITYLYPEENITDPKENFGCGSIGSRHSSWVWVLFTAPTLLFLRRRRTAKDLLRQDDKTAAA